MLKNGQIQITMDPSFQKWRFVSKSKLPNRDLTVIKTLVDVRWLYYRAYRLKFLLRGYSMTLLLYASF